jgi:dipeptidyl aminopeptidase/acylaminoacyl peptidase
MNIFRHLKWNERKFNGTLNDTRFGLKARGPAAPIALKLLEDSQKDEYICAFLDSPVNDLSQYHAVYAERLTGLKKNTQSSYRPNLRNKSIAIVHGTADEDVHFKHSATLANTFIGTHPRFHFKVYPDADHDFKKNSKIHGDYFHFQRQFFQECLGGRVNKERKPIILEEYD